MHHKATLNGYLAQFTGQTLDQASRSDRRSPLLRLCSAAARGSELPPRMLLQLQLP